MARPLLALMLALAVAAPLAIAFGGALPATAEDAAAAPRQAPPPMWTHLYFDASLLPGPTGWFAVPVVSDVPAYVEVEVDGWETPHPNPVWWTPIVAPEGEPGRPPAWHPSGGSWAPLARADVAGAHHECCLDIASSYGWGDADSDNLVYVAPDKPVWVGFVVANLAESDHFSIGVKAPVNLTAGEVRTGTRVEVVDLVEEAQRAGTRVDAPGVRLALAEDVTRSWTSERTGLFLLSGSGWGDASARLRVEVPGLEAREAPIGEDLHVAASAARPGTFTVSLVDVELPPTLPAHPVTPYGQLDARVLFADIDLPLDAAWIHATGDEPTA